MEGTASMAQPPCSVAGEPSDPSSHLQELRVATAQSTTTVIVMNSEEEAQSARSVSSRSASEAPRGASLTAPLPAVGTATTPSRHETAAAVDSPVSAELLRPPRLVAPTTAARARNTAGLLDRSPPEVGAAAATAPFISSTPSRFRVPPTQTSQTTSSPTPPEVRSTRRDPPSPNTRRQRTSHSMPQLSRMETVDVNSSGGHGGADGDGDLAARVLISLQHTDGKVQQQQRWRLQEGQRRTEGAEVFSPPRAPVQPSRASPERSKPSSPLTSPSWPATPERWWRRRTTTTTPPQHQLPPSPPRARAHATPEAMIGEPQEEGDEQWHRRCASQKIALSSSPPPAAASAALSAAHAALTTVEVLQHRLEEKEAELAELRPHLAPPPATSETWGDQAQLPGTVTAVTVTDGALPMIDRGIRTQQRTSAAPDAAGEDMARDTDVDTARARIAHLEWQLEVQHHDAREDASALQEHIAHLTRELRYQSRELARQQRRHKLELSSLQQEVAALADQLEEQMRGSVSVAAASKAMAAEEGEGDRVASQQRQIGDLQRALAHAQVREAHLVNDGLVMRRQWLREIEEQQSLLEEAHAEAREYEVRYQQQLLQERQSTARATEQLQQQEETARQYAKALAVAQHELTELRVAHQHLEGTVAQQREQLRDVSCEVATMALKRVDDEQCVARSEKEVAALQQQVRQAELIITSQNDELQRLRQSREAVVNQVLSQQEEEQWVVRQHVEGCMQGSAAMERALQEVEAKRQDAVEQLSRVLAERDEYHCLLRETSVQAQAQLLEQQQLLSDGHDVVCRRLREAQQALAQRTDALEVTQKELDAAHRRLRELESTISAAEGPRQLLESRISAADAGRAELTKQLVETKEALKAALQAHLQTVDVLRRRERQLRSHRTDVQRKQERRRDEMHALQGVVDLLWPVQGSPQGTQPTIVARLPGSGGAGAPRPTTTAQPAPSSDLPVRSNAFSCTSPSDLSYASTASTTSVVMMSTVGGADEEGGPANPLANHERYAEDDHVDDEDGKQGEGRSRSASEQRRVLRRARAEPNSVRHHPDAACASLTQGLMCSSRPDTFYAARHSTLSCSSGHHRAMGGDAFNLPVLRTIEAVRGAVAQLSTDAAAARTEVASKRRAVRTLVQERKELQHQLSELQAALQAQQHQAERQRVELARSARAEAQTVLEETEKKWQERLNAEATQQHRQHGQQLQEKLALLVQAGATRVQADLMRFIERLPSTLSFGVAAAASQLSGHHDHAPLGYSHVPAHAPADPGVGVKDGPAAAAAAMEPELQRECDDIIRDVLGLAGGWADLATVVAAGETTAKGAAPPPLRFTWSPQERAELAEAFSEYLMHSLGSVMPLPSACADDTSTIAAAAEGARPPMREGEKNPSLMGITPPLWMQSLRQPLARPPSKPSRSPARSSGINKMAGSPPREEGHYDAPEDSLLARLLDACVAHVIEGLLRFEPEAAP